MNTETIQVISTLTTSRVVRICTNPEANEYGTTAHLSQLDGSTPFAIPLSDGKGVRSIGIDFDSKLGDAFGEAMALSAEMEDEGIPVTLCASGPTGGYHVWLIFEEEQPLQVMAELRSGLLKRFRSIDPTGMLPTSYLRPPSAPHRLGGRSEIQRGELETIPTELVGKIVEIWGAEVEIWGEKVLSAFSDEEKQEELLIHSFSELLGKLSPRTLAEGQTIWAKGERSEAQFRFVLGCVNSGLNVSEIEILMEQLPVGARWRTRSDERELIKEVEKAKEFNRRTTERLNLWISQPTPSQGRKGVSERLVMESLHKLASDLHTAKFRRSMRSISEDTLLGKDTVIKAIGSLVEAGYLRLERVGDYTQAQTITLLTKKLENGTLPTSNGGCVLLVGKLPFSHHNLFSSAGLGPTSGLIYQAICEEAQTVKELAEFLNLSDKTLRGHLKTLKSLGLAQDSKRTWKGLEATTEALDELAESLLIPDRRKELTQRHSIERNLYQRNRERLRSSNEETFTEPF